MQNNKTAVVVTSIFSPNRSLLALAAGAMENKWQFIVVGDVSSPKDFYLENAAYYDIVAQKNLKWNLASLCPERHYSRKNIGYLIAMGNGCNVIVETDDDNIPNSEFWLPRQRLVEGKRIKGKGWVNIYKQFTEEKIWPRGFPLEEIHQSIDNFSICDVKSNTWSPIQQGLADANPDVDAIFRMTQKLPITFAKSNNYYLEKGVWCPFNSQNTTWFSEAFPLLYLPSFCSFRMTDIWRSFVAQRVIWECDWEILFHGATVWQERNQHNLLKDFEQEVPGYINNSRIRMLLDKLELKAGIDQITNNMLMCYEELVRNKIISDHKELDLLSAWLEDIQLIKANVSSSS